MLHKTAAIPGKRMVGAGGSSGAALLGQKKAIGAKPAEYRTDGTRRGVGEIAKSRIKTESPKRIFQRLLREKVAGNHIKALPGPGEEIVLVLDGSYHGFDLVAAVLNLSGVKIARLHIATLGFNRTQTRRLCELVDDGSIGRIVFLVSELFRDVNRGEFKHLHSELTARGQTVAATRNHCKLLCFELADGRRLAIHGSLNLRRCNAYEQVAISSDHDLHAFLTDFIETQCKHAKETSDQKTTTS